MSRLGPRKSSSLEKHIDSLQLDKTPYIGDPEFPLCSYTATVTIPLPQRHIYSVLTENLTWAQIDPR